MHVELCNFVPGARTDVFHIHGNGKLASRGQFGGRKAQVGILELGVAQSVAEWKQRRAAQEQVAEVLRNGVLVQRRNLVLRGIDGMRQAAGGVYVAEEDIRDGVAAFFAEPPASANHAALERRRLQRPGRQVQPRNSAQFPQVKILPLTVNET